MEHRIRVTAEVPLEQEDEVRALIERCALGTLVREQVPFAAFVDVTIVDDASIRALNAEYRGKDAVTDVLSFPMFEFYNGQAQEPLEPDPASGEIMLGDMVLNYERACQQAQSFGRAGVRLSDRPLGLAFAGFRS